MQTTSSRKWAVIALILISALLVGLIVIITLQIQQDQSPDDAAAFAFGENAVRTQFNAVGETFSDIPCGEYLNGPILQRSDNPRVVELAAEPVGISKTSDPRDRQNFAAACKFLVGRDKFITFRLKGYNENSLIDDTRLELFDRINGQFLTTPTLDSGEYSRVNYFFGVSKLNPNVCTTTLFHYQNDFEYAQMDYYGFDCNQIITLNQGLAEVFMEKIISVMYLYQIDDAILQEIDPENYVFDVTETE